MIVNGIDLDLIKLKLRENSAVAMEKQKERGTKMHPRIEEYKLHDC